MTKYVKNELSTVYPYIVQIHVHDRNIISEFYMFVIFLRRLRRYKIILLLIRSTCKKYNFFQSFIYMYIHTYKLEALQFDISSLVQLRLTILNKHHLFLRIRRKQSFYLFFLCVFLSVRIVRVYRRLKSVNCGTWGTCTVLHSVLYLRFFYTCMYTCTCVLSSRIWYGWISY